METNWFNTSDHPAYPHAWENVLKQLPDHLLNPCDEYSGKNFASLVRKWVKEEWPLHDMPKYLPKIVAFIRTLLFFPRGRRYFLRTFAQPTACFLWATDNLSYITKLFNVVVVKTLRANTTTKQMNMSTAKQAVEMTLITFFLMSEVYLKQLHRGFSNRYMRDCVLSPLLHTAFYVTMAHFSPQCLTLDEWQKCDTCFPFGPDTDSLLKFFSRYPVPIDIVRRDDGGCVLDILRDDTKPLEPLTIGHRLWSLSKQEVEREVITISSMDASHKGILYQVDQGEPIIMDDESFDEFTLKGLEGRIGFAPTSIRLFGTQLFIRPPAFLTKEEENGRKSISLVRMEASGSNTAYYVQYPPKPRSLAVTVQADGNVVFRFASDNGRYEKWEPLVMSVASFAAIIRENAGISLEPYHVHYFSLKEDGVAEFHRTTVNYSNADCTCTVKRQCVLCNVIFSPPSDYVHLSVVQSSTPLKQFDVWLKSIDTDTKQAKQHGSDAAALWKYQRLAIDVSAFTPSVQKVLHMIPHTLQDDLPVGAPHKVGCRLLRDDETSEPALFVTVEFLLSSYQQLSREHNLAENLFCPRLLQSLVDARVSMMRAFAASNHTIVWECSSDDCVLTRVGTLTSQK